jgi:molybdate transport system substrate-binding protein
VALSLCLAGSAAAADLRVFSSGAPAAVERVLAAQFARERGHHVEFTVANPAVIQQKLSDGEKPDIVILPAPIIDSLGKAGVLRPTSRVDLARVGVGLVVREGAPLPDISIAAAVRTTLLHARSIVIPDPAGGGQTGAALARMFAQMGIAEAVKPKLTLMQAIAGGVALVANGEVELGMFNISEVLPVKGVTLGRTAPFGAAELHRVCRRHSCRQHVGCGSRRLHQAPVRSRRARTLDGGRAGIDGSLKLKTCPKGMPCRSLKGRSVR